MGFSVDKTARRRVNVVELQPSLFKRTILTIANPIYGTNMVQTVFWKDKTSAKGLKQLLLKCCSAQQRAKKRKLDF